MNEQQMQFSYDRRRTSTLTLDEQPGAHTGATRKYIPGYSDSNIIFLNTSTGNDGLDGTSIANAKLTYASAVTAAGTTKKIRLVNSATLTSNITKPTEATIGTTSTIASSSLTAPVDTWTQAGTPSFGTSTVQSVTWSPKLSKYLAVASSAAKAAYSTDGNTWIQSSTPSFVGQEIAWCEYLGIGVYCGTGNIGTTVDGITYETVLTDSINPLYNSIAVSNDLRCIVVAGNSQAAGQLGARYAYSVDAETWETGHITPFGNDYVLSIAYSQPIQRFIVGGNNGKLAYSDDGRTWFTPTTNPISTGTQVVGITYCSSIGKYAAVCLDSTIAYSTDGDTWTMAATPAFVADLPTYVTHSDELGVFVAVSDTGDIAYSTDGNTWTIAATPSYGGTNISGICYSPLLGKFVAVGQSGKIAYSTAFATTISAAVAGFSIQAVQYSGTVTAYNCTLKQPGTTAALSLDACRVTESGSHISNNAVTSRATLYEGDRHLTCTPASQNAIDLNLDTWGGTFYIYNASQTGYERIRDCLGNGPIVANYPVTVGGRANVEGTSVNVLFDAEVTHNDPRFVDETDYKLEFQTNGYTRNSFAAARSNIYFNSAGDARDIGAWSYVESAVSHYYAKTEVMYKGEISHGLEFALNEQQGDSGVVSVYGNTRRVKEVITITYGTTYDREKAIFEYMLTLQDKGVKIQLDAEWNDNAGTVVVNGNQAAGVEFLTVDSTTYYEGMWLTISGEQYWVMRASPTPSAATKLILDRPLEDAVLDNDVIVRNYPAGAGEYQFSGPMNLTMKRVHPTALQGYYSGFQIRLVRKKQ